MNQISTDITNQPPYKEISIAAVVCLISGYGVINPGGLYINSVVLSIGLMIFLCMVRVPVTIALIASAMVGGMHSGLTTENTIAALSDNLLEGSKVGMTYIMIGAFAIALARSGLLDLMAKKNCSDVR